MVLRRFRIAINRVISHRFHCSTPMLTLYSQVDNSECLTTLLAT